MADRADKKLNRAFDKALMKEIKQLGVLTLAKSQEFVPVVSGELKASARIYHTRSGKEKGWSIIYFASYASGVEEGHPGGPANYTMNVKRHVRRLASGKDTLVSAHKKKYKNHQRPTRGPTTDWHWRIVADPAKAPNEFLAEAWATVRGRIKDKSFRRALPEDLDRTKSPAFTWNE